MMGSRAQIQRRYRARLREAEICPQVPVSARVVEMLILAAMRYGNLSRSEAEARSRDRAWVVAAVEEYLDRSATDWGVLPTPRRRSR